MNRRVTAIIDRAEDDYFVLCPELDVASQGALVEQARASLMEALELFFESATPDEVERRLKTELYITQVEVSAG